MPQPSASLATLRPELAGSLEEFDLAMDRQGFIGQRILPVMEVAKQAGNFGKIPIEQLLQSPETARASAAAFARGNWKFEVDSYATGQYGWEEPVDDREAEMYAEFLDAEQVSTERARDFILRAQEMRIAALLFNATTYTGAALTTAIVNEWDDFDNATPIADVEAAVRKVQSGTGLWPNVLILNRLVYRNLRQCAEIIERIQAAGAGAAAKASDVTPAQLAAVFDLEEVIVAGASKNTANIGATVAISQIWSNEYAMVARINRTNDIKEPGLGRLFHWGANGSQILGMVESYREEQTTSQIIRVQHDVQEKILYTAAAHLLSNATT